MHRVTARMRNSPVRKLLASPPQGAHAAPFPHFIEPCLATLRDTPPEGADWLHEIKYDGYRTQCHLRASRPRLLTRRGYDWTERFGSLVDDIAGLAVDTAILDGEVVAIDEKGRPDYAKLQADLAKGRGDRLVYFVFDLLYVDGLDLRRASLLERKRVLRGVLDRSHAARVLFSDHLEGNARAVVANACAMGLEGIVSKDRNAPYRSGTNESWIKVKCGRSDDFPIIAFVEKLGAEPRRIASLYIGRRQNGRLLYAGKARSGYTLESAERLRDMLDPYIRSTSPLDEPLHKPKATWVEPVIAAEIAYSSRTPNGLLREAVFKGIRDDLAPRAGPKTASDRRPGPAARSPTRVPRENILQLLPQAVVPSKEELASYWAKVGRRALRYLARRPLKLVRHSRGTTFYHKGSLPPVPGPVHQLTIEKREGGEGTRLWIDSIDGLIGLVAMGAVELHPWNATIDDLEHPDLIVFDLDPGAGIERDFLTETAFTLRDMLKQEHLDSWPKLTGGKGIHLMVPVEPTLTHDEARDFAKAVSQRLAATDRKRYVTAADPARRKGRIFIDYLRNGRGNTAIGTCSPRARPGFPVAARVTWKDIADGLPPDAFSLAKPPRR
jgi:bifunctional non-homologous end joining protein LigD